MINSTIFRKYDIRGIVNKDFTPEESSLIASGIIQYAKELHIPLRTLVVGRDARIHSAEIFKHFTAACKNMGLTIIDIGVVTTPILYFTLHSTPYAHGVMITASHNPSEYNGFKICLNKKSVHGAAIQRIKELSLGEQPARTADSAGNQIHYDALSRYIDSLATDFAHLRTFSPPIIFDCNNSPAGLVMPKLIKKLQWHTATTIHEELDGTFPNQEPDPTVEKNGVILKSHQSAALLPTIGIGFDGDADRMASRTETGTLVPGDTLLALLAKNVLSHFPNARIVFDIKSSTALQKTIVAHSGTPIMAPTGHANIKASMAQHKALLGGELSGHYFFADKSYGYDDGIYAALRLIELLHESDASLHELVAQIPTSSCSPEFRLPCAEENKEKIVSHLTSFFEQDTNTQISTIDGVRVETAHGWGLIRASNTEAVLSLRFEGTNESALKEIKKSIQSALVSFIPAAVLEELN